MLEMRVIKPGVSKELCRIVSRVRLSEIPIRVEDGFAVNADAVKVGTLGK